MLIFVQFLVSHYYVVVYNPFYLLLISSSTVLIALAGYLLNDIQDLEIDAINNKLKSIHEGNKLDWLKASYFLLILGLGLGFWASLISGLFYFTFFMFAALSLIAYAYYLSKWKIFGNILISALIALSILLCFYMEINHPTFNRKFYGFDEISVIIYAGIAFLLNWIRELIKDMEDIEGDLLAKRKSLAIVLGLKFTSAVISLILLFFTALFIFSFSQNKFASYPSLYFLSLTVLTSISLGFLFKASQTSNYSVSSSLVKLLMFLGMLLPLL
jgi:4-hydroxybenzoate polyprenyltransferase